MQFGWPAAFWLISWYPKLCQICWWIINNNTSFHYRLFPRKTNMTNFFKKSQKPYFEPILGSLCPNLGQKWIFLEERVHTKKRFVLLISLWDTANFRVLQLIEKSCNLIGQEHFGPYLRNQNFPKYEICSSIQELQ